MILHAFELSKSAKKKLNLHASAEKKATYAKHFPAGKV